MEKSQIEECLRIVTDALLDLEQAKADYKVKTDSAFETYELSPMAIKAITQIAKAKIKDKVEDVKRMSDELSAMLELVEESEQ